MSENKNSPTIMRGRHVLDDPNILTPQLVIYTSLAPSWDHMDPALPAFPDMPEGGPEKVIADHG